MGRMLLLWRLVRGDIKRRRAQSALLVVMIATTTTTLTLGLALHGVSDNPFARTRAATRGPDVTAMYGVNGFSHPPGAFPGSLARFEALSHAPGVVRSSGPYPIAFPQLSARGLRVQVLAEGRDQAAAAVDEPLLTGGRWVRAGGVVIERAFADALGVRLGDRIGLNGRSYRVMGIALTTADSFYPEGYGRVWLTRADLKQVEAVGRPAGYLLNLKLARAGSAPVFAAEHAAPLPSPQAWQAWSLNSWQEIRSGNLKAITLEERVLLSASSLLAMFAIASIAVLVGGRMAEQTRRVGLMKAVGATPRLIAVILLAENLLLALAAAILGLAAGRLLAPTLTHAANGQLGTPGSSPLTATSAVLVALTAAAVAAAATIVPAIRGARTSTITALKAPAHHPRRHPWLITLSARLPVPLLLGLRLLARRTGRAALTTASLTIAAATIVATLTLQHNIDTKNTHLGAGQLPGTLISDRIGNVVFLISAILIILAAINTIITTWATVIDSQRATALARALGATPRQVTAALTSAQLLPTLLATALGIPLGLELYVLVSRGGNASPPILWLLALIPSALLLVAALTAIPARLGARRPIAEVLRSD